MQEQFGLGKMNNNSKIEFSAEELKNALKMKYDIIIGEDDPIYAVIFANELIMNQFLQKTNALFNVKKSELEKLENNLANDVKVFYQNASEYSKEIKSLKSELKKDFQNFLKEEEGNSKPESKNASLKFDKVTIFILAIIQFIFFVVGIMIGFSIT